MPLKMNIENRSILIGMILGDGYVQNNSCGTLCLQHSQTQLDYLSHKVNILWHMFGGKLPTIHLLDRFDKRTNKIYKTCYASKSNKYIATLRKWIYINGKKQYTKQILDYLTPHGIAIWYMDDGGCHLRINKKTGKISSVQTYLYTYCSNEEAIVIQEYFLNTHGIYFSIHKNKKSTCCLCANTKASKVFVELIRPYIIESMLYKLRHVPVEISQEHTAPIGEDIV